MAASPLQPVETETRAVKTRCVELGVERRARVADTATMVILGATAKVPGPRVRLGTVRMEFDYADYFGTAPSTGYETLLYDVMIGDATLFHRADIVEAGRTVVDPIRRTWTPTAEGLLNYPSGSWVPPAADALIAQDGREWRRPGR